MGLGELFTRSTRYDVTNTDTGASDTFTIVDNLVPDWLGSGAYNGAMAIPAAWRASLLLSDMLGSFPWDAYRQIGSRPVETLSAPLLEQPNPPDPRIVTFSSLALDYLFDGNGIGIYATRDRNNYPTSLFPVSAAAVQVKRATKGDGYPLGTLLYRVGDQVWTWEDVLHIKGPVLPGTLRGMGVLEQHMVTFSLGNELKRQARNVDSAAVPTGYLKNTNPEYDDADLSGIKRGWMESQRTRTVAVLNSTTEWNSVAWNPTETQLLEARKFTDVEIANIFGIDASWLNASQSSRVYSNIEQEAINLVKFSLAGHLSRFEQTLSLAFPRGTYVKANLDALLRADTLTRYQAHAIALAQGFLTVDEVRELEERAPLTAAQKAEMEQRKPVAAIEAAPTAALEGASQ